MLLELLAEQVVVGGLAGEPVPVLCQHHGDAPGGHEVAHAVHAGPLQAGAALSGVLHLLEDLVAFSGGVVSEGFYLLGERVAGAGLLICRDAGVEDSPLRAVAVVLRAWLPSYESVGSTPRALASLRIVSGCAPLLPCSYVLIRLRWTPLFSARSPISHKRRSRSLRSFSPSIRISVCVPIYRVLSQ